MLCLPNPWSLYDSPQAKCFLSRSWTHQEICARSNGQHSRTQSEWIQATPTQVETGFLFISPKPLLTQHHDVILSYVMSVTLNAHFISDFLTVIIILEHFDLCLLIFVVTSLIEDWLAPLYYLLARVHSNIPMVILSLDI